MKNILIKNLKVLTFYAITLICFIGENHVVAQNGNNKSHSDMILWYDKPGVKWLDAMPIGNGLMGAMVFGGVKKERIALNESSFWSGRPHDYNDTGAYKYFAQIKDLVFANKFQEAEKMADEHFFGIPVAQQAFEPLGDMLLTFDGIGKIEDYRRELDMETGVIKVSYRSGDAILTREVFISYPDRVMVVRISSNKPNSIFVQTQLKSPFLDKISAKPGELVMDGSWKSQTEKNWLIAPVEGKGMRFCTRLVARSVGGQSQATDSSLIIKGANLVTFVVTAATSFVNYKDISGDPGKISEKVLSNVVGKDYSVIRHRHEEDFSHLMGRVHINLDDTLMNEKPIDERLSAYIKGNADRNLEALCFQFGRYILVSSSRTGGQPANLQGIWNEIVMPPWGSKFTININTEMNYWPTEVCNLSECHQPLFDMIRDISVTGAKTARVYYNCNGWVTHHNIDIWRGTAPVDAARFGMWPMGGAWLCQDLWEHFAFTGDKNFLKEYYPIMKGSAQFLLELMVEDPKHHWLVTPFSMSPEHGYLDNNGKMSFLSPSPTMDIAIIRELFPNCIEAGKVLGVDNDFSNKLEAALKRIPPYQIGRSGYLQEWIEDWKAGDQGHNVSPNFTFYPGSSIQLRRDPQFSAAIQNWMEAHPGREGFPAVWDISVWARLERGDKVAEYIRNYMSNSIAQNLHNRGANQSDATYGFTAGVAESLIQSHAGEISILPALPVNWNNGSVVGLKARGGYVVNIKWENGKLLSAEIISSKVDTVKVRYREKTASISMKPGKVVVLNENLLAKQ